MMCRISRLCSLFGSGFYSPENYEVEQFVEDKGTAFFTMQWRGKQGAVQYPLVTFRFVGRRIGENSELTTVSHVMAKSPLPQ